MYTGLPPFLRNCSKDSARILRGLDLLNCFLNSPKYLPELYSKSKKAAFVLLEKKRKKKPFSFPAHKFNPCPPPLKSASEKDLTFLKNFDENFSFFLARASSLKVIKNLRHSAKNDAVNSTKKKIDGGEIAKLLIWGLFVCLGTLKAKSSGCLQGLIFNFTIGKRFKKQYQKLRT